MRRLCFLLAFTSFLPGFADLATLESLTREWISLRASRAREAEDWRDQQARMRIEAALLEAAEKRLREEIESLRTREDEEEALQADLLEELAERQTAEAALRPAIRAARSAINEVLARLPDPLRHRLTEEWQTLEAAQADAVHELRALLALQNQLLHLQTGILVTPYVIEIHGARREMEVLWIGTARGFAVSHTGDLAARGRWDGDVLVWEILPGSAAEIRRAIRIARGEAPPALVRLPLGGTP